jgi:hypothetical protein
VKGEVVYHTQKKDEQKKRKVPPGKAGKGVRGHENGIAPGARNRVRRTT